MDTRRWGLVVTISSAALSLLFGIIACGGSGSDSGLPPNIVAPTGIDQSTIEYDYKIDTQISDPDGTIPSITWSQLSGTGMVSFSATDIADPVVRFPHNGIYQLRVTASDGKHIINLDLTVTVNCPTTFTLEGNVADEGAPSSSVQMELRWANDGTAIESITTGADGTFSFNDLIGRKNRFTVVVLAN